jgi:integrase
MHPFRGYFKGYPEIQGVSVLTDPEIKALKPQERPYKKADAQGLYMLVTPTGGRLWRFKYRHGGVEKLLALGAYPDVPLRRAREKRDEARRLVADGSDPSAARKAAKAEQENSFRAVADEWLALQAKTLADETIQILRGRLASTLYPAFGSRAIKTITAPDLLAVLKRLEANGTHETAHRVRALYGRVARFAIATGRAERDISADLKGALAPVVTEHFAAITNPKRMGELLRAIDSYVGQPSTEYALKLAPYVFVRPGELRGAEWSELDLESAEWRIPGERMKMGKEHLVPLAPQAVSLLRNLEALTGDGRYLFPSLRTSERPISDGTLNAALRRLGFSQDEMTTHGFRSMASTRLNEMGWNPDLIELQLAHAEKDAVRGAYNRAQRLDERRKMMETWATYLDGLKAGGKVVAIRGKRTAK